MFKVLGSLLRRLFKSKHHTLQKPKELILHNSEIPGWPKSITIRRFVKVFPIKIIIDAGPIPMLRPTQPIEYLFFETTHIHGGLRATYIQVGESNLLVPSFIWVFKSSEKSFTH